MWSLFKKWVNKCKNKHKVEIKLSKIQTRMTDLASYLLMQWHFWQLTLKWLSGARAQGKNQKYYYCSPLHDLCDIGFCVQFNAELPCQVINLPIEFTRIWAIILKQTFADVKWMMLNNPLDEYRYINTAQRYLAQNARKKRIKKARTRMQLSKTCSKYVRKRSSLVCMRQSFIFYPLFNFEWCIRFMTNEGFRCWWDYVVSSRRVWRQFIYEMALGHCEEKGKSFWAAEYLFRKRTRSGKIRKDQVQLSHCRKRLLAKKLENLLNYVKLFVVYLNTRNFPNAFEGLL